MAGGSMPVLPGNIDQSIFNTAATMKPVASSKANEYILSDGKNSIVYNTETRKLERR
jgi:hypothetical protein